MGLIYNKDTEFSKSPFDKPQQRQQVRVYQIADANEGSAVVHPSHYNQGKYEVIDVIDDWKLNFNLGNTVKYIARAGYKNPDKKIEDLEKALFYLNYEIERLKNK